MTAFTTLSCLGLSNRKWTAVSHTEVRCLCEASTSPSRLPSPVLPVPTRTPSLHNDIIRLQTPLRSGLLRLKDATCDFFVYACTYDASDQILAFTYTFFITSFFFLTSICNPTHCKYTSWILLLPLIVAVAIHISKETLTVGLIQAWEGNWVSSIQPIRCGPVYLQCIQKVFAFYAQGSFKIDFFFFVQNSTQHPIVSTWKRFGVGAFFCKCI